MQIRCSCTVGRHDKHETQAPSRVVGNTRGSHSSTRSRACLFAVQPGSRRVSSTSPSQYLGVSARSLGRSCHRAAERMA